MILIFNDLQLKVNRTFDRWFVFIDRLRSYTYPESCRIIHIFKREQNQRSEPLVENEHNNKEMNLCLVLNRNHKSSFLLVVSKTEKDVK